MTAYPTRTPDQLEKRKAPPPGSTPLLRLKHLNGTMNQKHTFWSVRGRQHDRHSVHIPQSGPERPLLLKRCLRAWFLPQDRGGISRCGEYQVIGGRRERADLFGWPQKNPVNAGSRWEERDVRLRSARSKMPIVCKALKIERWRGLVSLGLYVARQQPPTSRSIRFEKGEDVYFCLVRWRMYTTLTSPTILETRAKVG